MNAKKLLALGFLSACVITQVQSHEYGEEAFARALRAELAGAKKVQPAKSSKSFVFKGANDVTATFGGKFKAEYRRAHDMTFLNKDVVDEYAFFPNTVELDANLSYGERRYGRSVVEVGSKSYIKYIAGDYSKQIRTTGSQTPFIDGVIDVPGATVNMPLSWLKHLWAKVDLGAVAGRNTDTQHTLTVGMFDFELGRGISLGKFYGLSKNFIGVFTTPSNFSPFGMLVSGEILKDKLSYDLYWSRLEEQSGSFAQVQANGVGKTADIFAARLKAQVSSKTLGDWSSETYLMYNDAANQKVEQPKDSKSKLYTAGWSFEYKNGNWELGGEVARNHGYEHLFAIDRNKLIFRYEPYLQGSGSVVPATVESYSHITLKGHESLDGAHALYERASKAAASNPNTMNGQTIAKAVDIGTNEYDLVNADNRFRPAYTNDYAGWMVVLDGSYALPKHNAKISLAVGHASGDVNPHAVESNKKYNGFVGLNENYAGKRVTSALVLGDRKLISPLSFEGDEPGVINDPSFSDMTYVGGGVCWKLPRKNLSMKLNVLGFWTDIASNKFGSAVKADKFKGTEGNIMLEWEALDNLKVSGMFAFFKPGQYFTDIKGTSSKGNAIGDDTGFFGNIGLQYTF